MASVGSALQAITLTGRNRQTPAVYASGGGAYPYFVCDASASRPGRAGVGPGQLANPFDDGRRVGIGQVEAGPPVGQQVAVLDRVGAAAEPAGVVQPQPVDGHGVGPAVGTRGGQPVVGSLLEPGAHDGPGERPGRRAVVGREVEQLALRVGPHVTIVPGRERAGPACATIGANMAPQDDIDRLRAERDEWRRRAEVAEAVAAERLARAESAERALRAAELALTKAGGTPAPPPGARDAPAEPAPPGPTAARPATLRERWRRYTETIN